MAQRFISKQRITRELTKQQMHIGWERAKKLVDKFLDNPQKYGELLIESMDVSVSRSDLFDQSGLSTVLPCF